MADHTPNLSGMPAFISSAVSIAICTFNRARELGSCLESLVPQAGRRLPIVVVDNNSTDATVEVVEELRPRLPGLRYIFEPEQGLSHARNRALIEVGTEWVAFLDDDARVLPGYVDELLLLVAASESDCIGGVFEPWYRDGRAAWFQDRYATNEPRGEVDEAIWMAPGGNLLIKREVAIAAGGFPVRLGMAGGRIGYGEETRLQVELRRIGFRVAFYPDLRIEHLVPRHKQSVRWLLRSTYQHGVSSWQAFGRPRSLRFAVSEMAAGVWRAVGVLLGSIWRLPWDRDVRWQMLMVDTLRPIVHALGVVRGLPRAVLPDESSDPSWQ